MILAEEDRLVFTRSDVHRLMQAMKAQWAPEVERATMLVAPTTESVKEGDADLFLVPREMAFELLAHLEKLLSRRIEVLRAGEKLAKGPTPEVRA